jgi:hypothetical protein
MYKEQEHLTPNNTINLGSYYTKPELVGIVYDLLQRHISNFDEYTIMDTSCGYGSFLDCNITNKKIGADIDQTALLNVKTDATLINHNSLADVKRQNYHLSDDEKIIIVGNPPYNDTTSLIRNEIKTDKKDVDNDIKARDIGISFLMSYCKLRADFICVLHPLSYLIKKTNFDTLRSFRCSYKLIDGIVISSGEFSKTSKVTQFPIVIVLYEKNDWGMDYAFINNWNFKTIEGKQFRVSDFDYIGNYITKYPNKQNVSLENTVAHFWTMRDINALKRSKTFINKECVHTIRVTKENLHYYQYVDVFKKYIKHIPYYFGNSDIFIDNDYFMRDRSIFINCEQERLDIYFRYLLGEHYV